MLYNVHHFVCHVCVLSHSTLYFFLLVCFINEFSNVKKKEISLSLYWKCQLFGWALASLYWVLIGMIGTAFSPFMAIILFIGDLIIYILPTHLFRLVSLKNKWQQWEPKKLLAVVIPSILIVGLIFMVLTIGKNFLVSSYFWQPYNETFSSFFRSSWLVTWMTGIRLAAIWILAYYLYHYAQAQLKATKESARLSLYVKNAQLENLKAQLNPHFFFNSLNSIKALVSENPEKARRAIELLSELLRTSLYCRNTSLISLREEVELINDYLELEKIRFEDRLQVNIEIPECVLPLMILPLSIQTLVENAIKHGISHAVKGGTIIISAVQNGAFLTIIVQNPGQLLEVEDVGLGLKNLKERLQLQYNGEAVFSIEMKDRKIVSSKLILPV